MLCPFILVMEHNKWTNENPSTYKLSKAINKWNLHQHKVSSYHPPKSTTRWTTQRDLRRPPALHWGDSDNDCELSLTQATVGALDQGDLE